MSTTHNNAHSASSSPSAVRPGRRRIVDDAARREVCALVSAGCSLAHAASYVGCSVKTLQRECQRDVDFRARMRRARAAAALDPLLAMKQAAATHWRAAAWMLERAMPEKYGRSAQKRFTASDARRLLREIQRIFYSESPYIHSAVLDRLRSQIVAAVETAAQVAPTAPRPSRPKSTARRASAPASANPLDDLWSFIDDPRRLEALDEQIMAAIDPAPPIDPAPRTTAEPRSTAPTAQSARSSEKPTPAPSTSSETVADATPVATPQSTSPVVPIDRQPEAAPPSDLPARDRTAPYGPPRESTPDKSIRSMTPPNAEKPATGVIRLRKARRVLSRKIAQRQRVKTQSTRRESTSRSHHAPPRPFDESEGASKSDRLETGTDSRSVAKNPRNEIAREPVGLRY